MRFMLTGRTYDFVKRLVQIVLPAFATLYFTLAKIWDLPAADEVVGTIAAVTTFLGVALGISNHQYESSGAAYDGVVTVEEDVDRLVYGLVLNDDPDNLVDKKSLTLKVQPPVPSA